MKIALVNSGRFLGAKGGTEKVLCDMANALKERGHSVSIVFWDKHQGVPGFDLRRDIELINCYHFNIQDLLKKVYGTACAKYFSGDSKDIKKLQTKIQWLASQLKQKLQVIDADIFITFQPRTTAVLKQVLPNTTPVITMIHASIKIHDPEFLSIMDSVKASTLIQVLRPEFKTELSKLIDANKIVVVPNVVPQFSEKTTSLQPKLITVGRIAPGKRIDLAVQAFAKIHQKYPNWTFEIWGEKTNRNYFAQITELLKKEKLSDRVIFKGTTSNVSKVLQDASVFVFPSESEGFPLALTEAMAMGLACVGCSDCPSVNTLIVNAKTGILTQPSVDAIARELSRLMSNVELRYHLGMEARESMKRYSSDAVWDQWEYLLRKCQ